MTNLSVEQPLAIETQKQPENTSTFHIDPKSNEDKLAKMKTGNKRDNIHLMPNHAFVYVSSGMIQT